MTNFNDLPKDLMRIINCFAFDRDSLSDVFSDINITRDIINIKMNQFDMYIGLNELSKDERNNMEFPSVSIILDRIKNKPVGWCEVCSEFKESDTGECGCDSEYDSNF
jgi:hypothetical protein